MPDTRAAVLLDVSAEVERRSDDRLEAYSSAVVSRCDSPGGRYEGRLVNLSTNGTCVLLDAPIAPGTLVRVESGDSLLLAEVRHCTAEQNGYRIGLRVEHGLFDLTGLRECMREFRE